MNTLFFLQLMIAINLVLTAWCVWSISDIAKAGFRQAHITSELLELFRKAKDKSDKMPV